MTARSGPTDDEATDDAREPASTGGRSADGRDQPVLFDMDGVILRGRATATSVYDRATDRALDALDADPSTAQREHLRTFEWPDVAAACEELGVDSRAFWRLREEAATALTIERLRTGERTPHDALDVVREIAGSRPSALVSNNRHETAVFVAEYFDLPFGAVCGRDPTPESFARRKPEPDFLRETLAVLGVEDGLYVGDRASDVTAARRAGLEGVYVRRSHNESEPVPEEAVATVSSLADLPSVVE